VYRSLQDGGWDESLTSHDKFVVSWLGANDEWLDFCEQRLVNERPTSTNHAGLVDSIGIPFPECERRVWSVLEGNAFDVGSIIGPRAYAALSDEILIGLEGLINFRFYGSNFIRDLNHKFLRMNFKG